MTTKHLVAAFAAIALGALSLEAKDTVFFVGCHPDDIENCLGLMGCEPIFLSQINHNAMAHAVPGGVLEEFAISKTMKPVTWSPDMRWWYKDEFDSLFPKKRSAK